MRGQLGGVVRCPIYQARLAAAQERHADQVQAWAGRHTAVVDDPAPAVEHRDVEPELRHGLGAEHLRGRTEIELLLPSAVFVDAEAALEGAHRAESSIAQGQWAQAWGPAGIAYHIATRPFLTGLEAPWIDEWRRRLEEVRLRGLECFAAAGLGLGGPALAQAEERARMLTELAPYRETGHRLLMEALARRGNVAEALRAYEKLRVLLREELGIAPSPTMQGVHRQLLESAGS